MSVNPLIISKSLKPSLEKIITEKSPKTLKNMDRWLDHVYGLVRYGEPQSSTIDVIASNGLNISTDYKLVNLRVQSSTSGNVVITKDPQISFGVDGQTLTIEGSDNTKTVTLETGRGLKLKGAADFVLGQYDVINFRFNKNATVWVEHSLSTNS